MRKFFLKVTGKPSVEEKEEDRLRKEVRQQVEQVEGGGGARRRWRLAKNMLVAFKVGSKVLSVRMKVTTGLQVEREEEEVLGRGQQRRGGRRLSFLGQQYANMVNSTDHSHFAYELSEL